MTTRTVEKDDTRRHLGEPMGLAEMHAEILEQLEQLRERHPGTPPPEVITEIDHLMAQLTGIQKTMTELGDPVTATLVSESSRRTAHRPRR